MKTTIVLLIAFLSTFTLAACDPSRASARRAEGGGGVTVLATVNGVPITDRDVEHRKSKGGMGAPAPAHERSGEVLQTVVRDELVYQKAVQLGLDRDPEYRVRLDDLEAQVRTFRRQEMATRLRGYVQQQAAVTDAEARAYWEEHAATLQTRFHVFQIFYKGRSTEILRDHEQIKGGTSFEEVAWQRFAGAPRDGRAPWDLGELSWYQLPPAWRGVVDRLEPGQVSDVIRGEGERFWIVKLAGRRVDPAVTLATERARIGELLGQRKADELYAKLMSEVKAAGKVTYPVHGPMTATRPEPR